MLKQVQRCLINCPNNMLEFIGESESVSQSIIARLIELCVKSSSLDGGFRASLEKCIFRKLKNDEDVAMLLKLLFNKGNAQKERDKDVGNKISVILDVHNWQQYINPVASEATTIWLNRLFMASDAGRRTTNDCSTAIDAFGDSFVDLNEPMPSVRIKGNEVILRTMYESYPCQYRYRRINDGSYPISADNRSAVKKAFEWIAEPSRKHITWTQVNKKEFAFVYPNKLPKVSPRYASVFGIWQGESSASATACFEAVAGEFSKVFRGLPSREKPSTMRIFTIKKVDRARSKVVFTHNTTPEQLIDAADNWSCSCKNLPRLDTGENIAPFPLEVADTVNAVWKQNGERKDGKEPVIQMKHYQGIELLLGLLPESAERKLLHALVENIAGLIEHLGYAYHGGKVGMAGGVASNFSKQSGDANRALAVLGLLLYRQNIRKEIYMEEMAFLLGQLLHVSDELHIMYCLVVRKGDVPPRLAGGGMFVNACETPERALAQLGIRMQPYIAWAKQYSYKGIEDEGRESWRARWLLGLYGQLFDKIHAVMDKSTRFGDFEKAQLFIGFMASLPKPERLDKNEDNNEGGKDHE